MDESDYERGVCQDCRTRIQPYSAAGRCAECSGKRDTYINSLWGLNDLIQERLKYEALGLCFHCGTGLEGADGRLCVICTERSQRGRWSKETTRRGGNPIEENPYKSAWDCNTVDNSTYLTPTLGTLADRMFAKARYFRCKAERVGPRGREYARDTVVYKRLAESLRASYLDVRKYK